MIKKRRNEENFDIGYRLNEAYMSRLAVSTFNLPKVMYLYSLRPIVVGMLPTALYNYLHKRKMNR